MVYQHWRQKRKRLVLGAVAVSFLASDISVATMVQAQTAATHPSVAQTSDETDEPEDFDCSNIAAYFSSGQYNQVINGLTTAVDQTAASQRSSRCSPEMWPGVMADLASLLDGTEVINSTNVTTLAAAIQSLRILYNNYSSGVSEADPLAEMRQISNDLRDTLRRLLAQTKNSETSTAESLERYLQFKLAALALLGDLAVQDIHQTLTLMADQGTSVSQPLAPSAGCPAEHRDTAYLEMMADFATARGEPPQVKVAASNGLRRIGQALQTYISQSPEPNNQEAFVPRWCQLFELITPDAGLTRQLQDALILPPGQVENTAAYAPTEVEIQAVRMAQTEALAALILPQEIVAIETGELSGFEPNGQAITAADLDINPLIQTLTYLAASPDESNAVRAAAIAALERVGTLPGVYPSYMVQQLQAIAWAANQNYRRDNVSLGESPVPLPQLPVGVTAAEIAGRLTTNREQQTTRQFAENHPEVLALNEETPQTLYPTTYETEDLTSLLSLQELLREGLRYASSENLDPQAPRRYDQGEVRRSARTALGELYRDDIRQLTQVIELALRETNADALKAALEVAGTVNYRRQDGEEDLQNLARGIVKGMHEAGKANTAINSDIRREGAFALGQMAAHHPAMLGTSVELSSEFDQDDAANSGDHSQTIDVIEMLLATLNDSADEAVATAAIALGRYGIALESQSKIGRNGNSFNYENNLQTLQTCLIDTIEAAAVGEALTTDCSYQLPQGSSPDRVAIASAYALGQMGNLDDDDLKPLLSVLKIRDCEATANFTAFSRQDEVRDSITTYTLPAISSDDVVSINLLIDAVTDRPEAINDISDSQELNVFLRQTVCEDPEGDTKFLPHYQSRVGVLEALDQINMELPSVERFGSELNALLRYDPDETSTVQATATIVAQGIADQAYTEQVFYEREIADSDAGLTSMGQPFDARSSFDDRFLERSEPNTYQAIQRYLTQPPDGIRQTLTPYLIDRSALVCAGAAQTIASIGLAGSSPTAVDLLSKILVDYPQNDVLCAPVINAENPLQREYLTTLERLSAESPENVQPNDQVIPDVKEQILVLKQAAIRALGQTTDNNQAQSLEVLSRVINQEIAITKEQLTTREQRRYWDRLRRYYTDDQRTEGESNRFKEAEARFDARIAQAERDIKIELRRDAIKAIRYLAQSETGTTALCSFLNQDNLNCNTNPTVLRALQNERNAQVSPNQTANRGVSNNRSSTRTISGSELEREAPNNEKAILYDSFIEQVEALIAEVETDDDTFSSKNDQPYKKLDYLVLDLLLPMIKANSLFNLPAGSDSSLRITAQQEQQDGLSLLSSISETAMQGLHADSRAAIVNALVGTNSVSQQCQNPPAGSATADQQIAWEQRCTQVSLTLAKLWKNVDIYTLTESAPELLQTSLDALSATAQLDPSSQNSSSVVVNAQAIAALGDIGRNVGFYHTAQEAIKSYLTDDSKIDPRILEQIIQTLSQFEAAEVVPFLGSILQTPGLPQAARLNTLQVIGYLGQLAYQKDLDIPDPSPTAQLCQREEVSTPPTLNPDFEGLRREMATLAPMLQTSLENQLQSQSIVEGTPAEDLLFQTIYAIGEIRPGDAAINTILMDIAQGNRAEVSVPNRIAATYALGRIGQTHPTYAKDLLRVLANILRDDNPDELKVVATYAITDIGLKNTDDKTDVIRALLTTHEYANAENIELLQAVTVYAIGHLEQDSNDFASRLAASLDSSRSDNVRVVAAAYADKLYKWNGDVVKELIEATQSRNVAIRLNAVVSLGSFNRLAGDSNPEEALAALQTIFWNEQEYFDVRYEAGKSIHAIQQGWSTQGQTLPLDDEFQATCESLGRVLESSGTLRTPNIAEGFRGNWVFFVFRGSALITQLEDSETISLLLYLEGIRLPVGDIIEAGRRYLQRLRQGG
jgi:hypothetical protein